MFEKICWPERTPEVVVNHPSLRGEKSGDEDKYPSPESLEPTLFIEIPILQLTLS